jgi:apolipoprotein N-acyltransferase
MACVIFLFVWLKSKFNDRRAWWALLSFWLSFEYLHLNWDLSWPWLTLGNVFAHYPKYIQWYEFTGVLGGSLWIVLANILLFHSFKNKKKYTLPSLVIIIPILISFCVQFEVDGKDVEVVVVQPNIDPYQEKFDGLTSMEQLDIFIELAETKLDSNTNYLIGPETAIIDGLWENKIDNAAEISRLKGLIDKYPDLNIILGAVTYKAYAEFDEVPHTARKFTGLDAYYDVYNSAIQVNKSAISIYHKSKLVQGVEFTPFPSILEKLEFLTIDLGGITGSLGTQDFREVFPSNSAQIAPIICYESVFGEYTTNYARNGADIFAIITNDGWWKDTPGYKQHLNYASLRAIECRRAIARSANTGISAFIDSRGNINRKTNWDEEVVIKDIIKTNTVQTFYISFGDYIGRLSAFIAVMFLCFAVAKRNS